MDMISYDTVLGQTMAIRNRVALLLRSIPAEKIDAIPPTWKNNARWQAGHLIVTPALLTYRLAGQPLSVSQEYLKYFAKGSDPTSWTQADKESLPDYGQLIQQLEPGIEAIFADFRDRMNMPYGEPYVTSAGTVLHTPGEALNFSLIHDGIHLGMLLALKRNLGL